MPCPEFALLRFDCSRDSSVLFAEGVYVGLGAFELLVEWLLPG